MQLDIAIRVCGYAPSRKLARKCFGGNEPFHLFLRNRHETRVMFQKVCLI